MIDLKDITISRGIPPHTEKLQDGHTIGVIYLEPCLSLFKETKKLLEDGNIFEWALFAIRIFTPDGQKIATDNNLYLLNTDDEVLGTILLSDVEAALIYSLVEEDCVSVYGKEFIDILSEGE